MQGNLTTRWSQGPLPSLAVSRDMGHSAVLQVGMVLPHGTCGVGTKQGRVLFLRKKVWVQNDTVGTLM